MKNNLSEELISKMYVCTLINKFYCIFTRFEGFCIEGKQKY